VFVLSVKTTEKPQFVILNLPKGRPEGSRRSESNQTLNQEILHPAQRAPVQDDRLFDAVLFKTLQHIASLWRVIFRRIVAQSSTRLKA